MYQYIKYTNTSWALQDIQTDSCKVNSTEIFNFYISFVPIQKFKMLLKHKLLLMWVNSKYNLQSGDEDRDRIYADM